MATPDRRGIAILVLSLALLAGMANAKTYVVQWTFNVNATTVPRLKIKCTDSVIFSVSTNSTHDLQGVAPKGNQTNFPGICTATNTTLVFPAKTVTKPTNYTVTWSRTGVYYYICSVGQHCARGKMAIRIEVSGSCPKRSPPPKAASPPAPEAASPPAPIAASPPAPKAASPPAPVVASPPPAGKTLTQTWTFGVGPATIQAKCGDSVVFQSSGGTHNVVEVASDSCGANQLTTFQPTTSGAFTSAPIPLTAAGSRTFICTVGNGGHCNAGMRVTYQVTC